MSDLQWRIYYANGTTFDSTQGEAWHAPGIRVVVINQRHRDPSERSFFVKGGDFYLWKIDRWYDVTYDALQQYWFHDQLHLRHPRASLAGETVDNHLWEELVVKAGQDKDFYG
jgi:hypothetical protein